MKKEELIEGLKEKIESLSKEELSEMSIVCIISDKDGVGEMMAGKGQEICNSLCHAFVGNEALMDFAEIALNVSRKYKEQEAKKNSMVEAAMPFVSNKYKS